MDTEALRAARSRVWRWARSLLAGLPPSLQRPLRRCLATVRRIPLRTSRSRTRPVVLPGVGPVVLLDARGTEWTSAVAELEERASRQERLIMVTDQPVMHLARELTTMVEYVPTCAESVDSDFASARLAELRRLYAATIYVRLQPELKAPLS